MAHKTKEHSEKMKKERAHKEMSCKGMKEVKGMKKEMPKKK